MKDCQRLLNNKNQQQQQRSCLTCVSMPTTSDPFRLLSMSGVTANLWRLCPRSFMLLHELHEPPDKYPPPLLTITLSVLVRWDFLPFFLPNQPLVENCTTYSRSKSQLSCITVSESWKGPNSKEAREEDKSPCICSCRHSCH